MLADFENGTDRAIWGMVLQLTIGLAARGRTKPRQWAPITDQQFAENANSTPAWARERVNTMVAAGQILERYDKTNKWEYSIPPGLAKETTGEKIHGRCSQCKVIGQFTTEFIAMPLEYFTVLTPGLGNAALLVVAVVSRFSHERAWTAEYGLVPKWTELDISQFERMTPLEKRQIETGIAEAESKGCIEVRRQKGKVNAYRTLPENWANIEKRGPRLVEQPKKPKTPRTASAPKTPKTPANPTEQVQSSPTPLGHGWCSVCCHITPIYPVSAEELAQERAEREVEPISRPPRAGPQREKRSKMDAYLQGVREMTDEEFEKRFNSRLG
jgi:hypothetical protein